MEVIRRMIFIGFLALVLGIGVNQIHPQGIRFHQLLLLFPSSYSAQVQTVSSDSALVLMFEEAAIFLDIRSDDQFTIDHIPTAISLPFVNLNRLSRLDLNPEKPWIVYDFQNRSKSARYVYKKLKKTRDADVYLLNGGFAGWLEKQYPTEVGEKMKTFHSE
ncbi:rhodanese-like domain-containing protein [bacterium]|nr:rhodanese-like domain-containing protein [bacterium]